MLIRKAHCWWMVAVLMGVTSFSRGAEDTSTALKRLFGLGEVRVLAVSPDLRFLASAGQGGICIWDIEGSRLRHRLSEAGPVSALEFSSDGKVLLAAHAAAILAWDAESGTVLREYHGHQRGVTRLRFGRDNAHFASAGDDNTARVWSMATGEQNHVVEVRGSPIGDVALSSNGLQLVTVDTFLTNSVKIWDLASEALVRVLPMTNQSAQRCWFAPGGDLLTVLGDRKIVRWDAGTGRSLTTYEGIAGPITMIQDVWFPNDTAVAAACNDGNIYLWNLDGPQPVKIVAGEASFVSAGVRNDFLVAVAHLDQVIRLRQLPSGDALRQFVGHTTSTHTSVDCSPDGRFLVSGGSEASTRVWDRHTGELVRTLTGSPAGTVAASFSADGTRILTTVGLPNPGVRLWRTETGEMEREFRWSGSWPSSAALSKDGTRVAGGAQDSRIRVFDAATGALLRTLVGQGWISRLAFSPTAPLLASGEGGTEFYAALYNHESGQRLHTFPLDAGPVTVVEFNPSGDTLLVGWQDGVIRMYNAVTLELRREWVTQTGFLDAATFSPDGRFLLTGESFPNFVAVLWDVETGRSVRAFPQHHWVLGGVAFDPIGTRIFTASEVVREWSIADVAAQLRIDRWASHSEVRWSAGQLERAETALGPWQPMPEAVSPYREAAGDTAAFYRVRVE